MLASRRARFYALFACALVVFGMTIALNSKEKTFRLLHDSARAVEAAESMLKATRKSISGSADILSIVKSFVLEGRVRQVQALTGALGRELPLRVAVVLPDRYVRIVRNPITIERQGFQGETLLWKLIPVDASVRIGSYGLSDGQIADIRRAEHQRLAAFVLGMLGEEHAVMSLAATTVNRSADMVTITLASPDGFSVVVDIDGYTHTPVRVRHEAEVRIPRVGSAQSKTTSLPKAKLAEVTWSFEDWRSVDRVRVPHRISRAAGGVVLEDVQVDIARINPTMSTSDFAP